jgi:hypothetical protein
MAEPLVFDIREGISPEALERLRRAERIVLLPKDTQTSALGYWVTEVAAAEEPTSQLYALIIRGSTPKPLLQQQVDFGTQGTPLLLRDLADVLAGDVLEAVWTPMALQLRVHRGGVIVDIHTVGFPGVS